MKHALKISFLLLSGMALYACKPSARTAQSYLRQDLQAGIDRAEGQPNRRFRIENYDEVSVQGSNLGPESYASELRKIIVRYDVLLDDVGGSLNANSLSDQGCTYDAAAHPTTFHCNSSVAFAKSSDGWKFTAVAPANPLPAPGGITLKSSYLPCPAGWSPAPPPPQGCAGKTLLGNYEHGFCCKAY
ncbi:MAG: hypothetical protein ACRD19_08780 [Terriglobia bacterium]